MLFNSISFVLFLPIVFLGHWLFFGKNKSSQNLFLLIASYVFYSFWDWRFLFLLVFSTLLDYSTGIAIGNSTDDTKRRSWLLLSMIVNIGLLCYFKYTNFFIDSFRDGLSLMGVHINTWTLNIILPIGISFYTFHGISYVFDIYYERITPHKNYIDYALFVSYFPLLVAGPIERATHLLPQLKQKRTFDYSMAVAGARLILWGMFKKVVVADSLATIVNDIFDKYHRFNAATLIMGVVAFSFQIYGDFSGYSDIARGVSKLFGIDLIKNFNFPFLSRNIAEFWSRWHISLSLWLNDYVFTPLSFKFRNIGKNGIFLAILITFIISGFWHGAAWHFVLWGALNGLYFLPIVYSKKGIQSIVSKKQPEVQFSDVGKILLTYLVLCVGFLLFRAENMHVSLGYMEGIITGIIKHPGDLIHLQKGKVAFLYIIPLLVGDWYFGKYEYNNSFSKFIIIPLSVITVFYLISSFGNNLTFIYFQF